MPDDLAGKTVLIIDDEPNIRVLLQEEFEDFNADVSVAESGQAALELLKEKHFDIVFTDIKMPNGDGMWLISQIQNKLRQQPQIYLCSGYSSYSSQDLKELGVTKVFQKPFDFLTVVSEIIERN